MRESFLKKLISTIKCSNCGHKYELVDVKVVGHEDDLWFLSASCSSCDTQGLIVAVIANGKPAEVITDLTEADYRKFVNTEPVGVDDVVDMHIFLQNFDGDFTALFSEE